VYAALPNLASAHEQGLADFEAPTWFAVLLPRGASEAIIRKLNQAAFATADTPSVQEHLNVLAAPIHRGADFGGRFAVSMRCRSVFCSAA
jgi:tripartite-type tricarboxylate transporter receptor subunit TctC